MKLIRCYFVLDSSDRFMFQTTPDIRGIEHARAIVLRYEQTYRNSPHVPNVTLPLRLFAIDALGGKTEIPLADWKS